MKASWVSYRAVKGKGNKWDVWLYYRDNKTQVYKDNLREQEALKIAMQMNLKIKQLVKEKGPEVSF